MPVSTQHLLVAGYHLEASSFQTRVVDIRDNEDVSGTLGSEYEWIEPFAQARLHVVCSEGLVVNADLYVVQNLGSVERTVRSDESSKVSGNRLEIAEIQFRSRIEIWNRIRNRLTVEYDIEHLTRRNVCEIQRSLEIDNDLVIVIAA